MVFLNNYFANEKLLKLKILNKNKKIYKKQLNWEQEIIVRSWRFKKQENNFNKKRDSFKFYVSGFKDG